MADDVVMFECPRSSEGTDIPQLRQTKGSVSICLIDRSESPLKGGSDETLQIDCVGNPISPSLRFARAVAVSCMACRGSACRWIESPLYSLYQMIISRSQ